MKRLLVAVLILALTASISVAGKMAVDFTKLPESNLEINQERYRYYNLWAESREADVYKIMPDGSSMALEILKQYYRQNKIGVKPLGENRVKRSGGTNADAGHGKQQVDMKKLIKEPGGRLEKKTFVVLFGLARHDLGELQRRQLDLIGSIETVGPVEVTGYTCPLGTYAFNKKLAIKRAEGVADFLRKRGIEVSSVAGYPKCCYLSSKRRDYWLNRRVEVTFNIRR